MHFKNIFAAGGRRRSATLIRRRTPRRSRFRTAAVLIIAVAALSTTTVLAGKSGVLGPLPVLGTFVPVPSAAIADSGPVDDGPAPLAVRTAPLAARVVLDGRTRGRTPLDLHTSVGRHSLLLEADDSISTLETIDVPETGSMLDVALWTRHPSAQHLRPPYPGAQLADAAFLADGSVQLVVAVADRQGGQPAALVRESWLIQPGSDASRGPTAVPAGSRAAALAISPDHRRVATLQDGSRVRQVQTSAQGAPRRLDSVWVGELGDRADPGTAVFRLDPPAQTLLGTVAQEELAAIAWLPDSRHLLVASRFGDPAAGGPIRTRLLVVDAGGEGDDAIDAEAFELIVVPADVLLSSAVWSPDGRHVAVLLRAPAAPGAKRLVGLGVIDVGRSLRQAFQYVVDLGPEDGAAGRLAVAPVAWEPCSPGGSCGLEERLVYAAPVPNARGSSGSPLGLLGLGPALSATPGGVFVSTVSSPSLATGDAPRLGSATGMVGVAWRSTTSGVEGAPLLGIARDANKPLALHAIDPISGRVQDLGVQLAPEVAAGASGVAVRWDVPHGRALVLARSANRASGAEGLDAWLVDFSPAPRKPR